ncbi:MAG: SAM-dependent methyltransferase, partial [Flavobacteriales bacterium]|nr:SAM-dependent methyltransferase [Flavobacteriales bacterium]
MKKCLFYCLAFFEGLLVMAVEILAASYIKPIYGASLTVWTNVLAVTLIGLALGYFLGGQISKKKNLNILNPIWMTIGLLLLILPTLMSKTNLFWISIETIPGSLLLTAAVLFIPITL